MTNYVMADGRAVQPFPQFEETGIPLLRKVWEQIKGDFSAWRQEVWAGNAAVNVQGEDTAANDLDPAVKQFMFDTGQVPWDCGTACCLAGHTVMTKGYQFTRPSNGYEDELQFGIPNDFVVAPGDNPRRGGNAVYIPLAAGELLGLSDGQREILFGSDRRPFEIEQMVHTLEESSTAKLWDVLENVDPVEARRWEQEKGFRDQEGKVLYGDDEDPGAGWTSNSYTARAKNPEFYYAECMLGQNCPNYYL